MLRFQHDFPGLALIRLPRTYRCSPHVLGAAQALLAQAPPLLQKTCFSDSAGEVVAPPRVVLRGFWDSGEEVSHLALTMTPAPTLTLTLTPTRTLARTLPPEP